MTDFFNFFLDFMKMVLQGFASIFVGIWNALTKLFNFPYFVDLFQTYGKSFSVVEWIFAITSVLVVLAIYGFIGYLIYYFVARGFRNRRARRSVNELVNEVARLNTKLVKMATEKEKLFTMKFSQYGITEGEDVNVLKDRLEKILENQGEGGFVASAEGGEVKSDESRFSKLIEVDNSYEHYTPPVYNNEINLEQICERFRNFACSRMNLYYDIRLIRLFFAGMGATKLIVLQGISGTGKTSLPYAVGKFFNNDATMVSVQPSWRDRTEMFGFFNEFTKRYNETETLKRIYAAQYNDDINLIVLDEMNIARVEYYFAEMLSVLEMPNADEWKISLVPNRWSSDPKKLDNGMLQISQNLCFVGTANNDDSTFSVSDKVYDRAIPIDIDAKGVKFFAEDTEPLNLNFSYLNNLYIKAQEEHPVSRENLDRISKLDIYIIEKLRVAFGNRILKQLTIFAPNYVACGGTELDAIDYILANKIFRKFESLNLAYIRNELDGLILFLNKLFGVNNMEKSKDYLKRLKKLS